jgi:hypothetical protein
MGITCLPPAWSASGRATGSRPVSRRSTHRRAIEFVGQGGRVAESCRLKEGRTNSSCQAHTVAPIRQPTAAEGQGRSWQGQSLRTPGSPALRFLVFLRVSCRRRAYSLRRALPAKEAPPATRSVARKARTSSRSDISVIFIMPVIMAGMAVVMLRWDVRRTRDAKKTPVKYGRNYFCGTFAGRFAGRFFMASMTCCTLPTR